ncbi:MAG: molybdopterin-guanine dinucleotide biosynthesis protein B [Nitrospinaceae bacterium]|jgi:molybdopterin-guanine dinucleotide biosynthesis protein A|nr:molybdopterin-guanine dinucleotide biosynthesis protein B [Nitrospinaceae bacterium]
MDGYWEQFKTPFLCFAGFSGVGKTTLVERLAARFREENIRVGYYKHDSHRFKMDKAGKDTARVRDAGAGIVAINDPSHFGVLADNAFKQRTITHALEQCDCILIEGYKQSPFDKIVFLDAEGKLPIAADSKGIRAIVHQGTGATEQYVERGIPLFHRDEIEKIFDFVNGHFKSCASPLYGAVFVGGQSKRMGKPKFSLAYNGISGTEMASDILNKFCDKVFLSSRADLDMSSLGEIKNAERINDEHIQLGPVGGLATLMGKFPDKAWMITACDMPFIQAEDFDIIFQQRDPLRYGTCYVQKGRLGYEPMCAIYEPKFIVPLYEAMSRRDLSLSRIIGELPFKEVKVNEEDRSNFMNINTPDDYEVARSKREQEKEPS